MKGKGELSENTMKKSLKYHTARLLWKAHTVAVVLLVAFGSLTASKLIYYYFQVHVCSEKCIFFCYHYVCAPGDSAVPLALLIFILMAVPAVVRWVRWDKREEELGKFTENVRHGLITYETFYMRASEKIRRCRPVISEELYMR
jgi:hypothetical protein